MSIYVAGKLEDVKKFTNLSNLNLKDIHGKTPLHVACQFNRADIAKLLLSMGPDIRIKDNMGNTPLHYACMNGSSDIIQFFIDGKFYLDHTNTEGKTAILYTRGSYNVKIMLRAGSDYKRIDYKCMHEKETLCAYMFDASDIASLKKMDCIRSHVQHYITNTYDIDFRIGGWKVFEELIENGTSLVTKNRRKRYFCSLCEKRDFTSMNIMLKHGYDMKNAYVDGKSLLYLACKQDDMETIDFLIPYVSMYHEKDSFLLACDKNNHGLIELMMQHHNMKQKEDIFRIVCSRNNHVIIKLLMECVDKKLWIHVLYSACLKNDMELIKFILPHVNIDQEVDGHTSLHACLTANVEKTYSSCFFLLDNGADINLVIKDDGRKLSDSARKKYRKSITRLQRAYIFYLVKNARKREELTGILGNVDDDMFREIVCFI